MHNHYGCHYSLEGEKDILARACWSSLQHTTEGKTVKILLYESNNKEHEKLVIDLLDRITPTQIDETNKEILYYTTLKTYDQNLILLNFLRNLWWEQPQVKGYKQRFFEYLKNNKDDTKDPLVILTEAHIYGLEPFNHTTIYKDHSNCCNNCKVKTTKQLLEYKGTNVASFLQNK